MRATLAFRASSSVRLTFIKGGEHCDQAFDNGLDLDTNARDPWADLILNIPNWNFITCCVSWSFYKFFFFKELFISLKFYNLPSKGFGRHGSILRINGSFFWVRLCCLPIYRWGDSCRFRHHRHLSFRFVLINLSCQFNRSMYWSHI